METVPKRTVPSGGVLSAPSTVRKSVKVVSKKILSTQTNSQPVVKCVLKGTDPESKAIANKCKYYSTFIVKINLCVGFIHISCMFLWENMFWEN